MTYEERNNIIEKHVDICYNLLNTKGVEYANSDDPNANFKDLAKKLNTSPEKILFIYLQKHLTCVERYCSGKEILSNEKIEGRIHDSINYLLILLSLIEEKNDNS